MTIIIIIPIIIIIRTIPRRCQLEMEAVRGEKLLCLPASQVIIRIIVIFTIVIVIIVVIIVILISSSF